MKDANTPYTPKCKDHKLRERIKQCAEKIVLHRTIRHLTSSTAIDDILDDSVKGRQHILTRYPRTFKGAALSEHDIQNGDANAVCFGFDAIDPKAHSDYEIALDLKAVIAQKPAAFYKMRDLEFYNHKSHDAHIGEYTFNFSCTKPERAPAGPGMAPFFFRSSNPGSSLLYSSLPGSVLISYDLERMDEITVLHFFRFIDTLKDARNHEPAQGDIEDFYQKLADLDNKELEDFLMDVGAKMSETGEFNFYGSYQLDFDTIVSLEDPKRTYSITMSELFDALNANDQAVLSKAFSHLPGCFLNVRFCEYLKEKVTNKESLAVLSFLGKKSGPYKEAHASEDRDAVDLIHKECSQILAEGVSKQKEISHLKAGLYHTKVGSGGGAHPQNTHDSPHI